MNLISFLGTAAFVLTCLIQMPQVFKIIRTHKTRDISLATYSLMWLASGTWVTYGLMKHDMAVAAANIMVFCLASTVLVYKLRAVR